MRPPVSRLRFLLARVCTSQTMERIIDPAIADLQMEHAEAIAHGRRWDAAWIRVTGYLAILRAMALHAGLTAMDTLRDLSDDERRAVMRTIAISAVLFVVGTLALAGHPVASALSLGMPGSRELAFGFWIAALPLAIPFSLTLGILWGCGGAPISRLTQAIVLALALGASVVSFITLDRIAPTANVAFARAMTTGRSVTIAERAPTLRALTSSELQQRIASAMQAGSVDEATIAHRAALLYHARFAQAGASLALALFAVALTRRRRGPGVSASLGLAAIVGYLVLAYLTRSLGADGTLSPFAAAWTPNAVLLMLTAYVMTFRPPTSLRPA
ncbi:MAG: LptF/LptG family permease [Acidobacteria bacterium]|nr:LptF/LptG family permease [Acidobacteriota bacterium]